MFQSHWRRPSDPNVARWIKRKRVEQCLGWFFFSWFWTLLKHLFAFLISGAVTTNQWRTIKVLHDKWRLAPPTGQHGPVPVWTWLENGLRINKQECHTGHGTVSWHLLARWWASATTARRGCRLTQAAVVGRQSVRTWRFQPRLTMSADGTADLNNVGFVSCLLTSCKISRQRHADELVLIDRVSLKSEWHWTVERHRLYWRNEVFERANCETFIPVCRIIQDLSLISKLLPKKSAFFLECIHVLSQFFQNN